MGNFNLDTADSATAHPLECIIALAESLGISALAHTHAGRVWEHKVDDQWTVAINANRVKCTTKSGAAVDPFCAYVEYNGWPAAILTPDGEGTFAMGSAANVTAFCTAVIAAARAVRR